MIETQQKVQALQTGFNELPPYPNGWYSLLVAGELKAGRLIAKKFCGRDVVLFRTQSGKAAAVDAYCPHLGAHFAHGGDVRGETIHCPFHDFCFDTEGNCTSTGYGTKPPPKAILRSYPVRERNGFILVYHDEHGRQPHWEVPEIDFYGWTPLITKEWELKSHPQETTENSVDIGHLTIVHGYNNVEMLTELNLDGHYLGAKYAMHRKADMFGKAKHLLRAEFFAHAYGLGYSYVEVSVPEYDLHYRNFVQPTPTEEGKLLLRIGMSMKHIEKPGKINPLLAIIPKYLLNKLIPPLSFRAYAHDVSQDFKIWENKVYLTQPALAKGDGPIGRYRQWARQFYEQLTPPSGDN